MEMEQNADKRCAIEKGKKEELATLTKNIIMNKFGLICIYSENCKTKTFCQAKQMELLVSSVCASECSDWFLV